VDLGSSVTIAFTRTSGTSTFAAGTSEVLTTAGGAGLTAIDAALATVADERAKLVCDAAAARVNCSKSG
jgi:hypothetical protein